MSDDRVQETWTYAGIRLGNGNKKYHAWIDATGRMLHFAKISGISIGGRYTFDVTRAADGSFQSVYGGTRQYANDQHEDADKVAGWQAEHRLAEVALARDRAERKAKAEPDSFELAIQPLRELRAKSCRSYADRVAFTAMVLEALAR